MENVQGCPSGQWEQTVNLPAQAFEGSNPSPCTNVCGSSSVGRASAFQAECRGFESRLPLQVAAIAQLVEHVLGKDEVTSSILVVGSKRLGRVSSLPASDMLPRIDELPRVVLALDPNASSPIPGRARARAFRFAVAAA